MDANPAVLAPRARAGFPLDLQSLEFSA
jgi:hypothetical protein